MGERWQRFKGVFTRGEKPPAAAGSALAQTRSAEVSWVTQSDGSPVFTDPRWAGGGQSYLTPIALSSLWTYACASLIAASAASVPMTVEVAGVPDPHHELMSLLSNPTPDHGFREWQEMRAYNLLLSGADYLELYFKPGEDSTDEYAEPTEMWPYAEGIYYTRTQMISQGRPVVEYFQRLSRRINKERVIRSRFVSPGDFRRGLAPAIASLIESQADREASKWQRESYKNRMVPDALFIIASNEWPEIRAAEKYVQQAWQGALNAHRPVVLGGGAKEDPVSGISGSAAMTYQQLTQSALEADFVNSRQMNRRNICAAFDVPEVLFGASDSTFSNLAEARLWFWEGAVKQIVGVMTDSLNAKLARRYRGQVKIVPDYSKVPALLSGMTQTLDIVKSFADLGVPMKQLNSRFDLGLDEWQGWDRSLVGPAGKRFVLQDEEMQRQQQQANIELINAQTAAAAATVPEETAVEDDLDARTDNIISMLKQEV